MLDTPPSHITSTKNKFFATAESFFVHTKKTAPLPRDCKFSNSKFLFQDVAIMLSGAIACLFTVPVSIRCVIRQIHHAASETDHS